MRLGYLAYKNLISKPLNMVLSLLLLVLSISLVTFVLQLSDQLSGQMDKNITPVDMVVGAKGSPLQLVLSSVLHVDAPTGNIKLKETALIQKHPFVDVAIPVSYGDNYRGYRILGTELTYLERYNAQIEQGKLFNSTFEIVVGYNAAQKLGLKLGDKVLSSHGLAATGQPDHEEHPYEVVGILGATGTVVDQLLICNLESIWDAHAHVEEDHEDHDANEHKEHAHGHEDHEGHDHEDHEEHDHEDHEGHEHETQPREDAEITSLLVKFKSPLGLVQLPRFINENTNMQAALPGFEVQRLLGLLGSGVKTINGIALAILLVSGFSIFISLLKTIRERRQELAVLRTYGLGTFKLLVLVLFEGLFLAIIGYLLGWILGRLGLILVGNYVETGYGYYLKVASPTSTEILLFGATVLIAIISVLMASSSIFKLNISKELGNE